LWRYCCYDAIKEQLSSELRRTAVPQDVTTPICAANAAALLMLLIWFISEDPASAASAYIVKSTGAVLDRIVINY